MIATTARGVRPAHSRRAIPVWTGRIWLITAIAAAATLGIALGPFAHSPAAHGVGVVPWLVVAAGFFATEMTVARARGQSDVQSFSLTEVPLLLGLFFLAPSELLYALCAGVGLALAISRTPFLRVGFVLATVALRVVCASLVFHGLPSAVDPASPEGCLAATAAVICFDGMGLFLLEAAVWVSSGRLDFRGLPETTAVAVLGAVANGSLALLVVTLVEGNRNALWMVLGPALVLCFVYRAYVNERRHHGRVQWLHEATRVLQRNSDIENSTAALAEHARAMLRSELAEIVLLPIGAEALPLCVTVGPGADVNMSHRRGDETCDVIPLVEKASGALLLTPATPMGRAFSQTRGLKDAIAVALRGESGLVGSVLVANRFGTLTTFDEDDLALLETFARHIGSALANVRLERQLRTQAFHDSLTQLANRALFNERVESAIARRSRGGSPIAILLLDLDDFKLVNDTVGHSAGDELLVLVSDRIRTCLRPEDTAARLGGDEFAVLLEQSTASDASSVAQRILDTLGAPFHVAGEEILVHGSVGVVTSRAEYTSVDKLLSRADVAMYHAKSKGKGRFEMFEPNLRTAILQRQSLKTDLQRAVDRDEFELHYQPIVDLASGGIYGAEALLRWTHPERGRVAPLDFVEFAEETGLILPIGRIVLEAACRQAAIWRDREGPLGTLSVSVNLSVRELHQTNFVETVEQVLSENSLDPTRITLEITESILVGDSGGAVERLQQLKRLGVQLAIDDFGTGYSSLSALRNLPIDMLKIAKPFIDGLGFDAEQEAFAHAILRLGTTLNLIMVAEGIETLGQATFLRDLGCQFGQGYHFAGPMAAAEFEALLDRSGMPQRPGVLLAIAPEPRRRRESVKGIA
ncbi:MAG TPA: EAL domain-containing protein [Candidatus Dormibacteraeota bacterium]|nr:EAL domain-containing protein [Candidatus Dormibacteraeota bacterium]